MKKIVNMWNWNYRNQIVSWKTYKINWFNITKYKPNSNSFFQKFAKDFPENVIGNFWNIWYITNKEEFEQFLEKVRIRINENFFIYKKITHVWFEARSILEWFDSYKKQILTLFDELLTEENYFGFSLPLLYGQQNNSKRYLDYKNQLPAISLELDSLEQSITWIFKDYTDLKMERKFPYLFPDKTTISNLEASFIKNRDKIQEKEVDDIIVDLFKHFAEYELGGYIKHLEGELAKDKNESEKTIKTKLLYFFQNTNSQYDILWDELYAWLETNVGNGFYFYPAYSLYSKIFDISFVGRWKNMEVFENKVDMQILKSVLKEQMRKWNIEHYVIKTSFVKTKDIIDFENDEKYVYIKEGEREIKMPLNIEDEKLLKGQEKKNVKWRYGLTIGLYGYDRFALDDIIREIIAKYKDASITLQIDTKMEEDVFYHNNWLAMGTPNFKAMNEWNFLALKQAMGICPETIDFRPEIYFWINTGSWSPVFLAPFRDLSENKNMIVIWKSWSWKTVYMKQFLLTNHSDKCFVIDPTWTFANIWGIEGLGVKSFSMNEMKFNPITLDKEFYSLLGVDYSFLIWDKINLFLDILEIDEEEGQENNWLDFVRVYLGYMYEKEDVITIDIVKKYFVDFIDGVEKWKLNEDLELHFKANHIIVSQKLYDFYWLKIQTLLLKVNWLEHSIIGKMLRYEEDLIPYLFRERFVIFDISGLGLTDNVNPDKKSLSVLLFLLYSFSLYTNFYKSVFETYKDVYGGDKKKLINNYIVIDEAHLLTKDDRLARKMDGDIRTVRNRQTSMVLMSQGLWDIEKMWKEVYNNINIKIFFKYSDIEEYFAKTMSLMGSEDEGSETLKEYIEDIKLYMWEFKKIEDENKKKGLDKRYVFIDYNWSFYINEIKLSKEFINKNMF